MPLISRLTSRSSQDWSSRAQVHKHGHTTVRKEWVTGQVIQNLTVEEFERFYSTYVVIKINKEMHHTKHYSYQQMTVSRAFTLYLWTDSHFIVTSTFK